MNAAFALEQTRCGIAMDRCYLIGYGLAVGHDVPTSWSGGVVMRLFDPTAAKGPFRGYVQKRLTRARAPWRVSINLPGAPRFTRDYRTQRGAERVLVKKALQIVGGQLARREVRHANAA